MAQKEKREEEKAGEEKKKGYTYEFYHEIGKKGGETTKEKHGDETLEEHMRQHGQETESRARSGSESDLQNADAVVVRIIDIVYPASREDLINSLEESGDVEQSDKEWVSRRLQDRTYKDSKDVMRSLGIEETRGAKGGRARGSAARATEEAT